MALGAPVRVKTGPLMLRGAEVVALAEHFHYRAFVGTLLFLAPSAGAALALIPLRKSAEPVGAATPTVWLAATLIVAVPLIARHAPSVYSRLRRQPPLELIPVACAGALIAYPLRSELWWPACTLLMLVAIIATLRRTLAYVALVLATNIAAHVVAGDLADTPAVSIIGLWIGLVFWSTVAAVFTERCGLYLLKLNFSRREHPAPTRRLAPVPRDDPPQPRGTAQPPPQRAAPTRELVPRSRPTTRREPTPTGALDRLTVRQVEVIVLLADGLRYQEVADALAISRRQVQRHVAGAVERAGARNANQLIALAVSSGVVASRVGPTAPPS